MARRIVGNLPTRDCLCIAAFFGPDVGKELRRRAKRDRVGAGRIVERIVSSAILAELKQKRARRAQATPAGEQVPA